MGLWKPMELEDTPCERLDATHGTSTRREEDDNYISLVLITESILQESFKSCRTELASKTMLSYGDTYVQRVLLVGKYPSRIRVPESASSDPTG